jgi:hypothetical protein
MQVGMVDGSHRCVSDCPLSSLYPVYKVVVPREPYIPLCYIPLDPKICFSEEGVTLGVDVASEDQWIKCGQNVNNKYNPHYYKIYLHIVE